MGTQISTAKAIDSVLEQSDSTNVSSRIINAIQSAATRTGVNFSYLMQKASQESSFDPTAKATSSSATGLFQFTSQTWLHMIKTYGDQYGLSNYAAHITADSSGHLSVDNAATRQAILALRKDPQVSAEMAGELDKENAAALQQKVGGTIGGTELYLAHFLGANGASHFIRQMRHNPKVAAADVLPSAAASNPSVFYTKSGQPRSLQQIYQHFAQKFDDSSMRIASTSPASSAGLPSNAALSFNVASLMPTANAATLSSAAAHSIAALRSPTAGNMTLASADGATMFNAMLMGQVERSGLTSTAPISAIGQGADNRKKVAAYAMLS
ncbi:MAG: transglycosylase SLT domain-containing protein [Alphaproteobacteria bacterium]|nr:transglycosylase SLT domain-containing protein [Alphaproteobacteria bacterium]